MFILLNISSHLRQMFEVNVHRIIYLEALMISIINIQTVDASNDNDNSVPEKLSEHMAEGLKYL